MLPSLLSEQLCSLRKGHERLAVSVIWTLESSTSFAVQDVWLGRSVIRSRHELHYQQAQVSSCEVSRCVSLSCLSCCMLITVDGPKSALVGLSLIALTLDHPDLHHHSQDIADGKPSAPGDELPPQDRASMACSLDILIRLTASLHATRVANGALELSSSELRFQVCFVCFCVCVFGCFVERILCKHGCLQHTFKHYAC